MQTRSTNIPPDRLELTAEEKNRTVEDIIDSDDTVLLNIGNNGFTEIELFGEDRNKTVGEFLAEKGLKGPAYLGIVAAGDIPIKNQMKDCEYMALVMDGITVSLDIKAFPPFFLDLTPKQIHEAGEFFFNIKDKHSRGRHISTPRRRVRGKGKK